MITAILFFHVAIAATSIIVALFSMKDTFLKSKENANKKLNLAWLGTATTFASGISLAIIADVSFGKVCLSLFIFLAAITTAQSYFSVSFRRSTIR